MGATGARYDPDKLKDISVRDVQKVTLRGHYFVVMKKSHWTGNIQGYITKHSVGSYWKGQQTRKSWTCNETRTLLENYKQVKTSEKVEEIKALHKEVKKSQRLGQAEALKRRGSTIRGCIKKTRYENNIEKG